MRILQLTWEYPPLVYGGLGRHVHGLARAQARAGNDVVVLTQDQPGASAEVADEVSTRNGQAAARAGGPRIVRTPPDPPTLGLPDEVLPFVLALQTALVRTGFDLLTSWRPDVVHAHDWVTAHAGITLARMAGVPLVATIHATEAGLWNGWIVTALSRARHEVERWLAGSATQLIVCSRHMRSEAAQALGVSPTEVTVIPNGVDTDRWRVPAADRRATRTRLGLDPDAPLLVQAGRLEWEKGGHISLAALARVRAEHPATRLVFAGTGAQEESLRSLARRHRLVRAVDFVGRVDQRTLAGLFGAADVVLVPSAYEPFGLVALEAMAVGSPVVVADTGGLADIVEHDVSGLVVPPLDVKALAVAATGLLSDPARARRLARTATRRVRERFTWDQVARQTDASYAAAVRAPRPPRARPAPPSYGNVFTGESPPA